MSAALPLLFVMAVAAITAPLVDRPCTDCGHTGHEPGTPACPREES